VDVLGQSWHFSLWLIVCVTYIALTERFGDNRWDRHLKFLESLNILLTCFMVNHICDENVRRWFFILGAYPLARSWRMPRNITIFQYQFNRTRSPGECEMTHTSLYLSSLERSTCENSYLQVPILIPAESPGLKSIWIWDNRSLSKGSKLLFSIINVNKIKVTFGCLRYLISDWTSDVRSARFTPRGKTFASGVEAKFRFLASGVDFF